MEPLFHSFFFFSFFRRRVIGCMSDGQMNNVRTFEKRKAAMERHGKCSAPQRHNCMSNFLPSFLLPTPVSAVAVRHEPSQSKYHLLRLALCSEKYLSSSYLASTLRRLDTITSICMTCNNCLSNIRPATSILADNAAETASFGAPPLALFPSHSCLAAGDNPHCWAPRR